MDVDLSDVELGFAVNLKVLRTVLSALSKNGRRWWIASDPRDAIEMGGILVGHGDPSCVDRLNTVLFRIPVINDTIPRRGVDSLLFLADASTIHTTDAGYYFENNRVVQDPIADLDAFFEPLRSALIYRFTEQEVPNA